ncbi:hypothetical protein KSS87_011446 [Heliosperma pusillum]|nr:hypothetical protein KSS87_011446 [Heliosperma pusillum]
MASLPLPSLSLLLPSSSSYSIPKLPHLLSTSTTAFRPNFLTSAATATATAIAQTISIADVGVGEDLPEKYDEYFPSSDASERRRAGILLHPTSLPGPHGIGDLGENAFRFDANCGNTLLISLEELVKDGLLTEDELPKPIDAERVNFAAVAEIKDHLVAKAAERLILSEGELKTQLQSFRKDPSISSWLEDAAYFAAIDNVCNTFSWYDWPEPLKNRHLSALEKIYQTKTDFIDIFIAEQFLFQRQWKKIQNYARLKGIKIMGDMPIYVGYHSADVWANRKLFLLNRKGFPLLVSGVPPDAFSETGQLWNRIDHFRGLAGFWAVPSEANTAMLGKWKAGPGKSLFDAIFGAVGKIDIIAEDLGVITEDVVQLRKSIGAPGMAVLQFGFGSDADNPHLPHNHEKNQVVYTGTHDNDTVQGWWDDLKQEEKSHVLRYLSLNDGTDISWDLIKSAISSVAKTVIIPMQDVLRLGSSARMNIPATQFGNWSWRIPASVSFGSLEAESSQLRDLLSMYGRL